jgi:hypothetical protein
MTFVLLPFGVRIKETLYYCDHKSNSTLLANNVIWKKCRVGSVNREEKRALNLKIKVI